MAFLDNTGVQRLWEHILAKLDGYAIKPVVTELTLSVPTTGWTEDATYGAYTQTFTATGATTDSDIYIDCPVGSSFPLVGARCTTDGSVILYMSDVPTLSQSISIKFKKEG